MKTIKTGLKLILLLPLISVAQHFDVMTYNIKYDNKKDTVNNWNDRKEAMVVLLKEKAPAFIGMQEVLLNQLEYLDVSLPSYKYIGVGRDDGKTKGEFSPIFFDATKFKMIRSNTFWLSKTPNKVSIGWDAAMERICTYGLFQNKVSGKKIWIFNTHFDHIGARARKRSVHLILRKIKEINSDNLSVILMGDFNLTPEQKPIQMLQRRMEDGASIPNIQLQPKGTFNGFDTAVPMDRRIDYIFVKNLVVDSYVHLDERLKNGKHISDHLPVLGVLRR